MIKGWRDLLRFHTTVQHLPLRRCGPSDHPLKFNSEQLSAIRLALVLSANDAPFDVTGCRFGNREDASCPEYVKRGVVLTDVPSSQNVTEQTLSLKFFKREDFAL